MTSYPRPKINALDLGTLYRLRELCGELTRMTRERGVLVAFKAHKNANAAAHRLIQALDAIEAEHDGR